MANSAATDVPLYTPRPLQTRLHEAVKRFSVLVAHRRFGKGALYH